jgi:hypothetical protein
MGEGDLHDVLAGQAFEPINDHAFFGNACVELIGHQTNLHHQTGYIRPDLHGCHVLAIAKTCLHGLALYRMRVLAEE